MTKNEVNEISTPEEMLPTQGVPEELSETGFNVPVLVKETEDYYHYQNPDGKYVRKLKYKPVSTIKAESREERINLMKVRDEAIEMNDYINKPFLMEAVIIDPYDSINEDTGETEYGATTTFFTDGFTKAIVTSSKTVYLKVQELIKIFGNDIFVEGSQLTVKAEKIDGRDHKVTTLKLA